MSSELELIYRQVWCEPIFSRDENASPPRPIELALRIVSDAGSEQMIQTAISNGQSDGVTIHLSSPAEQSSGEYKSSQAARYQIS